MKQLLFLLLIFCGCDYCTPVPPERKPGIPQEAVWAGGLDGGAWIQCSKQKGFQYSCSIYNDFTGELMAKGVFFHRRIIYDSSENKQIIKDLPNEKDLSPYNFFDGVFIHLAPGEALVPDGEIIWPFDEKHGKKQYFENGVAIGEEIQY
jgi:hypothetical protein